MKNKITFLLAIILFLGLASAGTYFYKKAYGVKNNKSMALKESEDLVARVSKLILLPKNEMPTIATVSEPEKLKDKPFFAKAKVGDKVLLYANAKMVYLYDPLANRVLEVASIDLSR